MCFAAKGTSHEFFKLKIYIPEGGISPPLGLCLGT